jgi:hypothetical protein
MPNAHGRSLVTANLADRLQSIYSTERLEIFKAMKIHVVVVLWIMTPRSDVVANQRFGGPCCLVFPFLPHHYTAHNPEYNDMALDSTWKS